MKNILVDTNFLIYSFDNNWDIHDMLVELFSDKVEIYYLDSELDELSKLNRNDVIKWLEKQNFKVIRDSSGKMVDDSLIEFASKNNFYILTQDRALIKRALKLSINVVSKGNKLSLKIMS